MLLEKRELRRKGDKTDKEANQILEEEILPSLELIFNKEKKRYYILFNNGNYPSERFKKRLRLVKTKLLSNAKLMYENVYREIKDFYFEKIDFTFFDKYIDKENKELLKKAKDINEKYEKDFRILRLMRKKFEMMRIGKKPVEDENLVLV